MSHVFVGMQIINPKILNRISEKCFSMSAFYKPDEGTTTLPQTTSAIELKGKYFHIGTVAAIAETEEKMN